MDLLNDGLFVGLGVALLRRTDLAPFSGWRMYVDTCQEKGSGGICCSRKQPFGAHRLGFLAALAVRVLLVVPACGLPVVYLIVIGWLMLGSWIVLRFRSLLC